MSHSSNFENNSKLSGVLPVIASMALNAVTASQMETAEIITDLDQMDQLLGSLQDIKQGKFTPMIQAFSDI